MKIILLIMLGLNLLQADFTRIGNIVKDSVSKLEFQDDAIGSAMIWEEAINHCETLTLGGHSDWRLPNINELKSIVDRTRYNPAIKDAFVHTASFYFSSTSSEAYNYSVWTVHFEEGSVAHGSGKKTNTYVRCVRDGQ